MEGTSWLEDPPDRRSEEGADDHARAEDPARAARADGQRGGKDLGEGQDEHDPQRNGQQLGTEALLHPAVAGAEHFGDDEAMSADQQATDGRAGPARQRRACEEVGDAVEAFGVEQPDEAAEKADEGEPAECEDRRSGSRRRSRTAARSPRLPRTPRS